MGWIREKSKNLLALTLGLFIALIVLEIFLRAYNPFEFRVKGGRIILPAKAQYTIKNTNKPKFDEVITHTKNSIGFRGSEPPKNFDDYMTIITVGGSTTECFYLSDGKDWPHVLGIKLKGTVRNLWINNAGLDGHTTFGHSVLMEDYITKKYKPKMVLFLIGGNEVGLKDFSIFDRGRMIGGGLNTESIKAFLKSASKYSEVLNSMINIYWFIRALRVGVVHTQVDLLSLETFEVSQKEALSRIVKNVKEYLPYYKKRVKHLVELARNNGIEPCFITQPALYGDAIDDVTGVNLAKIKLGASNGKLAWDVLQLYNTTTKEVGTEENVLVIDLANEMPKSSRYFYDWLHFTNEGAQVIAEIIAKHLSPYIQERFKQYSSNKENL